MGTIAINTGLGLGGLVGGMINETWGWRWAFFVVLPLIVVSGIGFALFLPDYVPYGEQQNMRDRLRRIDFSGSFTLVSALVVFMYGLNSETTDGIPSVLLLKVAMPIATALLAVFVLIEIKFAQEPILPIKLLRLRTVSGASLTGGFVSTSVYILMFYVPLYFQLLGLWNSRDWTSSLTSIYWWCNRFIFRRLNNASNWKVWHLKDGGSRPILR